MNKVKIFSYSLIFASILVASSANAATNTYKSKSYNENMEKKGVVLAKKLMFEKKDINKDGYLTRRELESNIRYKFEHMDMNRDKYISKKEMRMYNRDYRKAYKKKFEAASEYAQHKYKGNFKMVDMNNDKMVSHKELKEHYNKNYNFSMFDINNDGRVTEKEYIEYKNTR